jgi:hypothetical protein
MDLQSVKNMLQLNTDKHDSYLAEAIPLFIDQAQEYCNNTFVKDELPSGVKLYVVKAIEHNMQPVTLKGRTMGEVSYSFETELPKSIMKYLAPYRRVRFS